MGLWIFFICTQIFLSMCIFLRKGSTSFNQIPWLKIYERTTELKVQESPLWAEDLKLREGEHTQVTALLSAKEWGGQMWAQPLTPSCSRTSYVPFFLRRSSPLWTRDNCTFLTGLLQGLKEMRHVKCLGHSKCSINICYYMIVGFLGRFEK